MPKCQNFIRNLIYFGVTTIHTMNKQQCKVLLAATGSVATIKIPKLIQTLLDISAKNYDFEIHLIVTERAKHFLQMSELPSEVKVYDDEMEWAAWGQRGDPVLHIELGKIADVMVLAPLNANTMAKLVNGICDNLVTCTVRAWDIDKPLLFCPAMNVRMWTHPVTADHVGTMKKWGYVEIPPICKQLACGDHGMGGMAEVEVIVESIVKIANEKFKEI